MTYKITTKSGNSWVTSINLSLDEAKEYFIIEIKYFIIENFGTGEETRDRIINVKQI
jgi:hypothetical protein